MFGLNLFGVGSAHNNGRPLSGFPHRLPCLLLCYLALYHHRSHSREHLAALIWGDHPTAVARKRLSHALWWLRKEMRLIGVPPDEHLTVVDDTVSFRAQGCQFDIEAFEAAVLSCRNLAGHDLDIRQATQLEAAVELYRGPLLEGVYDDWCVYERERMHLLFLDTLAKLADYHEFKGSYRRGLEYGERILACDDTREKTHRQMMRLYWRLGDQCSAVAQYKRCTQLLRETMGLAPMAETDCLYQRILMGESPAPRVDVDGCLGHQTGVDGLSLQVVRQALHEVRRLENALDETRAELRQLSGLLETALLHSASSVLG